MSGITDFILGKNEIYERSNPLYHQDMISADASVYAFEGNVKEWQTDKSLTARVDNVVNITTATNRHRKDAQDYWKDRRSEALKLIGASVVVGLGGVGALIYSVKILPVLCVVSAVSSLVLGIARNYTADSQLEAWENPVEKVISARKHLAVLGDHAFPIAFQRGYAASHYISKPEIQNLWHSWAPAFMKDYTTGVSATVDKIKSFFTFNPLDQQVLTHTFGFVPPQYSQISTTFMGVKAHFDDLQTETNADKGRIIHHAQQQIGLLQQTLDMYHTYFNDNAEAVKSNAAKAYLSAVEGLDSKNPEHKPIIDRALFAKNLEVARAQNLYNVLMAPYNLQFRTQSMQVTQWKDNEFANINKANRAATAQYADWVSNIANAFKNTEMVLPPSPFTYNVQNELPTYSFGTVQAPTYSPDVGISPQEWSSILAGIPTQAVR
ncbi:MAG: hypothetical protein WC222_10005 [Parachlamydiales bacterium]|jgi:hypothetical protein